MELNRASWLRSGLTFMIAAQVLSTASAICDRAFYQEMIRELCMVKFKFDMAALDRGLWCSWPDTMEIYGDVTNCTFQIAIRIDCFWPNHIVDNFFMDIHNNYFQDCALTGRLIHDPPVNILAPFIAVPVFVTLLMTAIVMWRSKRSEGIL